MLGLKLNHVSKRGHMDQTEAIIFDRSGIYRAINRW